MPPVEGCTKQDYAVLIVIGVGVEDRTPVAPRRLAGSAPCFHLPRIALRIRCRAGHRGNDRFAVLLYYPSTSPGRLAGVCSELGM